MRVGYVDKIMDLVSNNRHNVRNLSVIAHVGTLLEVNELAHAS